MKIAIGLLNWCLLTVGGGVWGYHAANTPGNDFQQLLILCGMVWGFMIGGGAFALIMCWKRKSKK